MCSLNAGGKGKKRRKMKNKCLSESFSFSSIFFSALLLVADN